MKPFQLRFWMAVFLSLAPLAAAAVAIEPGGSIAGAPAAPMTGPAAGQPQASVQFRLLTSQPRAGEPVEFEVKFEAPPAVIWNDPVFGLELGKWVVVGHQPGPYSMQAGYQIRKDRLQLLTYASGKVEVPATGIKLHLPDNREGMVPSQGMSIVLQPPMGKTSNPLDYLRGLKQPIAFFPWLQAFLTLIIVAALLRGIWWYARRTGLIQARPIEPPRPPAEIARERLAALRASGLLALGQYKNYYSDLTEITRRYLEGRFALEAMDRTTSELMRILKAKQFPRQDMSLLREILERADLAKFAKARPNEREADSDWQAVADWVERTAPIQPVAAENAGPTTPGGEQPV